MFPCTDSMALIVVLVEQAFRLVIAGKAQGLLITMALFYSSVPVRHVSVTVSQHVQKTGSWKQLNGIQPSLILLFTPVLCLTWSCPNIFCEKGPSNTETRERLGRDLHFVTPQIQSTITYETPGHYMKM